ncbi:MdtA/MuxA family multidrug efflux RND transporter periplasmic adaptor subunit [Paucibacter sp. B2R-40]|uniref:MdtA/MuxA family multidrug efflux RND transporter periplasmic adaptor subunit n=1 Tax=Paucibacter sp. B2R-40 TaxID=2893554 RepID=UPI0021E3B0A8|nr:MdtA/MuxA family multidrug efflux RND transporter periplasmic adaptor subunit [Paucibacter sp. B2R-40]MCV2355664.1 MdtA/MuxA family multidrug efflux RND transporter periplasmic adaptor subunit [Paucibacter sp. B2R-40]
MNPSPNKPAPPKSSGQRALPWAIATLLALGAGGAWWAYAQQRGESSASSGSNASASGAASAPGKPASGARFGGGRVQPVSVASVAKRDIQVTVSAIGTISAANTAVVKAKIEGELKRIHFKEGQWVKAGALLAELDDRALQINLAQTEGQLARDQALLQNARLDLERFRELLAKDAIAKQQVDTQAAQVRQLQGTVQIGQALVDNARLQLSYTRIVAPIEGRVGLKQVDLGNVLKPGDVGGLISIAQSKPVNVVFAVPDIHLRRLNEQLAAGQKLQVEAWDREGLRRLAVGQLGSSDNAIDAATGTIKLKAAFPNADLSLFPNQFVNVRLQLATLENQLAVPAAALLRDGQGSYVYRVGEDKTVSVQRVQAGASDQGWVSVQGAGLQVGERIVTDGVDRLREGSQVEVIKPQFKDGQPERGGGRGGKRGQRGADAASAPAAASSAAPAADKAPKETARNEHQGGDGRASGQGGGQGAGQGGPSGPEGSISRLPPELAEKLRAMSPDERRAFIEQRRAERAKREAGQ